MKTKKEFKIPISKNEAVYILGKEADFFEIAENSVFCHDCFSKTHKSVSVVNYDIFVNDLGDIILQGFCKNCGHRIGRYIESGEKPAGYKRAMKVVKSKENWFLRNHLTIQPINQPNSIGKSEDLEKD